MPPCAVLLVAGGTGTRMGAALPKQFLPLAGEPVLLRTLRRWWQALPGTVCVVVLPAAQHPYWASLLTQYAAVPPHQVVTGGATRLASVRAGLAALPPLADGLVAIHDGVRPLVPATVIHRVLAAAATHGAAVAAVAPKDSVRRLTHGTTESVAEDRRLFRLVQTPQCFRLGLLRAAYAAATDDHDPTLTDDASVVARLAHPVVLVEGAYENLKITTPEDLVLAEALLRAGA